MSKGRPVIYENYRQTSFNVPTKHLELLKDMNIDMGELCREAIAKAVGDDRKIEQAEARKEAEATFQGMPKDEVKNMVNTMRKTPEYLPKVLEWANKTYDKKITKEDLEKLIPKY